MPRTELVHLYLERAEDLFRGMQLTRDEELYQYSAALLAIHSAISFADALRVGLDDTELSAENHDEAIIALKRALRSTRVADDSGIARLQALLSRKSEVAYAGQRFTGKQYQRVLNDAERFVAWANRLGVQLGIEGWRDVDNR